MTEIVKTVQTCLACPSQWDAWDSEGSYLYFRYRHGYGSVRKWLNSVADDESSKLVAEFQLGDSLDGFIELEDFVEKAGLTLSANCDNSILYDDSFLDCWD